MFIFICRLLVNLTIPVECLCTSEVLAKSEVHINTSNTQYTSNTWLVIVHCHHCHRILHHIHLPLSHPISVEVVQSHALIVNVSLTTIFTIIKSPWFVCHHHHVFMPSPSSWPSFSYHDQHQQNTHNHRHYIIIILLYHHYHHEYHPNNHYHHHYSTTSQSSLLGLKPKNCNQCQRHW